MDVPEKGVRKSGRARKERETERETEVCSFSDLPSYAPAVYAICGGRGSNSYVAYVGMTYDLKKRIMQHFVKQNSSISTGTAMLSAFVLYALIMKRRYYGEVKITRAR